MGQEGEVWVQCLVQSEHWSPAGMLNTNQTPALLYWSWNYISTPYYGLQVPVWPGHCPPSILILFHHLLQWMLFLLLILSCFRNLPSSVLGKPLSLPLNDGLLHPGGSLTLSSGKPSLTSLLKQVPLSSYHPSLLLLPLMSPVTLQSVIHINCLLFCLLPYCLSPAPKEVIYKARGLVYLVYCCIRSTEKRFWSLKGAQ